MDFSKDQFFLSSKEMMRLCKMQQITYYIHCLLQHIIQYYEEYGTNNDNTCKRTPENVKIKERANQHLTKGKG